MNAKNSNPGKIVRAQHRAAQFAPLMGVLALGLSATLGIAWYVHPSLAPVSDWRTLRIIWAAGLGMTAAAAIVLWRKRRPTLIRSAAEIDATFGTHNRLEAATALQDAKDAMARAQRDETEKFLQASSVAPRRRWLAVLGTLAALLATAHLATIVCWARPTQVDATKKVAEAPEPQKKPKVDEPTASIEWQSPESETSATAIEEVPLDAEADSTSGLRNAVLEIEVNGEHRLSQPVTENLAKPGKHGLKLSVYLDQLDVKTYDMVSYHISADRVSAVKLPPTASPVQFVQIRPMREDTFVCAGGDQPSKCFNYVTALKAAQLRLMKDNFTLGHAEVAHSNEEWTQENSRVGNDQKDLAARASDVITMMTTNHYPPEILSLVRESQPLMTDAGGKIVQLENIPALTPQGKALGYLTEVEKYLKNSIKLASNNQQPKPNDPFKKPKNLDLKTHPLTRAGKIDALASEQARLAGDLASGNTNSMLKLEADDSKNNAEQFSGSPGERQTQIKERIADFLNDPAFEADALKHLQSSDDLAGKSQEQIDKSDFAAATEPAAEAARELRATAAALRAGGDQTAKNKLADALLQLAAAAGNVRRAPQAKSDADAAAELKRAEDAVREAAKQLMAESQRQQGNGAKNASARLGQMAQLLNSEALKQMIAQAQQSPRDSGLSESLAKKLDDLAQQAGQQRNTTPPTRQELARLIQQLQRTQANLNNLASQCKNPGSGKSTSASTSAGQSPGQGSTQSSAQGSNQGSGQGQPAASGKTGDLMSQARSPEMGRAEMQRMQGMQLLDDLRLAGMEARGIVAPTVYPEKLDQTLRAAAASSENYADSFPLIVAEIDPPLTGLINSLQTQLATMRRSYQLAAKETAQAPAQYRAAVADYFERVSRDYSASEDHAEHK